jgi:hypothetical protein
MPEPALDRVPGHRGTDRLGNDESGTRQMGTCRIDVIRGENQMHHEGPPCRPPTLAYRRGEILPAAKARGGGQHLASRLTSGRKIGAALGPAGREDRAPGAGAHAQPEAVGLRTPTVVRLVGALAHVRHSVFICPARSTSGRAQSQNCTSTLPGAIEQPGQRTRPPVRRQNGRVCQPWLRLLGAR